MRIRVNKRIGRGGFSFVYEATTPEGKVVALKQSRTTRKITYPMLLHEACTLSLLAGHPSIPAIHAWGRSQYFEYLTLDLLGTPLCNLVKHKPVKWEEVLPLLNQMLDSLEHLHSRHLIHRDIKPDNFLFGLGENSGRVHLVDYGLAQYYRDPTTLLHRAMSTDLGFVGTGQYASRNAHLGLSLSRRDDLESLAYSIAFLLRGSLPWSRMNRGTPKHRQDRVREKKISYSGKRLFEGFPQELADFTDYVCGLRHDEEPDYHYWKTVFLQLSRDFGFSPGESFNGVLTSSCEAIAETTETASSIPDATLGKSAVLPPVSKGDYVLVQITPHLTIEGRDNDGDTSRWHDPTFSQPHWQFPARPALVLAITPGEDDLTGLFIVSVLPLVYRPGATLSEEEKKRLVHVGRVGRTPAVEVDGNDHPERRVIPTPRWNAESIYHSVPPRAFKVVVHPGEAPVNVHWKLKKAQLNRLKAMIREPYPSELSSEAQGIIQDFNMIGRNPMFAVYASVSPLIPAQMTSLSQIYQSSGTVISWRGPRGFIDETLQIGRRRSKDANRSWYEVDPPSGPCFDDDDDDDDDDFYPEFTWPAARGISKENVLANWESILDDIRLLTEVPLLPERVLLNEDETMTGREEKLGCS
ncbi:kinase-like protein [Pluteus cervinus]|uniref:Kinase-like protein n=1 Tax=Pluteus cervinus TaxID=181527 RepID=A0ACD3B3W7_9AGAR|nr:kinase-like protein [Pluteus cervinus]